MGGGLAGLATAVKLLDAGVDVELIEKRDVLGGKTSSWVDADGDHIESGLHCYFRCYKELIPFFRHVGVDGHIRWKEHSFLVARPGGNHARLHFPQLPAPLNGVVAFTNNDLFTLREKISNLLGLATTWIGTLDYIKSLDHMSFREWRVQHCIAEGVERKLWNAISLSLGFIPADEMSARPMATIFHYFATVADASQFGTLDGSPNERIFKPIAEWIAARGGSLRSGARATELLLERGGVAGVRLADGSVARGDAYVLAAPVHSTRQLLPESLRSVQYFDNLWKLRSVPTINVQLWFDRYISTIDTCWFTGDACFSVFADLALTSPLHYDRHGGSMVEMCVAPAAPYWQLTDAEIVEHLPARPSAALARRRGRAADQGDGRAHPQLALPRGAGRRPLPPRPALADRQPVPGRRLDRAGLYGLDGGRRAERAGGRRGTCGSIWGGEGLEI